jgi:Ribonuclease G/E
VKELVIKSRGPNPAAALTESGKLIAYFPLVKQGDIAPEAVFIGRAGRVLKNLEALFVDLPGGVSGYLPFGEIPGGTRPGGGDLLIVQVKKPPQGNKAAFLTADIALPGRYALLLPRGQAAHASNRVDKAEKTALTRLAVRLRPQGMGLVLRQAAEGAEEADIAADIAQLTERWQAMEEKAKTASAPMLLMPAPSPLCRILREERPLPRRVLTDDIGLAKDLGIAAEESGDPFALYNIGHQLYLALRRRVYLPSGGTLVIDPCEAGTVVDVNTGKNSLKGADIILKTNLEAAREAARLIRLRNLGGIILIDFIDMKDEASRQRVQAALEEALALDPVKTVAHGFTRLGLMEITRKKTAEALHAQTLSPCPHCEGSGYLKGENTP